jgi:hypothetical protein
MSLPRSVGQPVVARLLGAKRGRRQNFWSAERTNVVAFVEAGDGFGSVMHGLANPVLSGLVDKELRWPGARSLPQGWS